MKTLTHPTRRPACRRATMIIFIALALIMTGCAVNPRTGQIYVPAGQRGQAGAGLGAATGALVGQIIGHNTEATLIGTAVGTMLGYIAGNEMDKYDRQELNRVYERGVSNQTSSWVNPDTGNQYRVTPMPAYRDPSTHRICRKAEIEALIDGKMEKTYTTACRGVSYGRWEIQ